MARFNLPVPVGRTVTRSRSPSAVAAALNLKLASDHKISGCATQWQCSCQDESDFRLAAARRVGLVTGLPALSATVQVLTEAAARYWPATGNRQPCLRLVAGRTGLGTPSGVRPLA